MRKGWTIVFHWEFPHARQYRNSSFLVLVYQTAKVIFFDTYSWLDNFFGDPCVVINELMHWHNRWQFPWISNNIVTDLEVICVVLGWIRITSIWWSLTNKYTHLTSLVKLLKIKLPTFQALNVFNTSTCAKYVGAHIISWHLPFPFNIHLCKIIIEI